MRLRFLSHDTYGCVPVCSSVAGVHAVVGGTTTKESSVKSSEVISEANLTRESGGYFGSMGE